MFPRPRLARLRGWRTFAVFSPLFALGLLTELNAVDLTPLLAWAGIPEPSRAAITTGMAVLAALLRVYTSTPVFRSGDDDGHGCEEER